MVRLLAAALLLFSTTARALPPDRVIFLAAGDDKFEKCPQGSWVVESTDVKVVEAKYFPAAEIHLLARSEGTALVVLTNRVLGQVSVWRIRVGKEKPEPRRPDPSVLKKPCACGALKKFPVTCQVKNAKCLSALRDLFETADLTSRDLYLKYSVEGLQALLKDLQSRLEKAGHKGIQLAFLGANLRISGEVADQEAWRGLLLCIYRGMVGSLVIENRVELTK